MATCVRSLALFALWMGLAWAQNIDGTITGVVEDPSGGRVPNARITALNQETGVRYSAAATEAGVYVIPQLPLGMYTVTVDAAGFKTFVQKEVSLGGDARLRVDARLELGGATETVTVSGAPPLVELERATVGGSFTPELFDRLPIGRDPMAVLQLVPGAQTSQGGFATGVFNGAHEETTDYKADGASATLTSNYRAPQPPIEEMVEEVVLQSGNYSAEYGRGAAQLSINTRAGTNQFHGVLFEYLQNEDLNANGFFNNLLGNGRAVNRENLFGATIGGPFIVPRLYNGRNRTFFTFGYQGTRSSNNAQFVSTVPSAALRAGDFTGQPAIYDPNTTALAAGNYTRTPFANNRIPANRLDPVALNILANSYPLPNRTGTANNYTASGSSPLSNASFNARLDHNFSDKNRATARYTRWYQTVFNFDRFPGPAGAPTNNNVQNNDRQNTIFSAEDTYVVRADLVNTLRFGYFVRRENLFGPGTDENWGARLGLKNAGPEKFPLVAIAGLTGFGGGNLSRSLPGDNYQVSDTVLWVKGRHSLKLGLEFRELRDDTYAPGNSSGSFTFNTLPTQNPSTKLLGVGFASFLLGIPSSTALTVAPQSGYLVYWPYWALFVQDDFRVNKKLTLNVGLRWEMNTPFTEEHNRMSSFNLATNQLDLAGVNGYPKTLFDSFHKGFGPRFGFAYAPYDNSHLVIRGGYGVFFLPSNAVGGLPFTTGPWSQNLTYPSPDNGITFPITLAGGLPASNPNAPFVLTTASSVNTVARHYTPPYMQQWNLNVQRQIGTRTVIQVGYVGTKGNHMGSDRQLNQVPLAFLGPGNLQTKRPYPAIGNVRDGAGSTPVGNSQYHALQVRFERRMQHGITAQAAYTRSKSIDDFAGSGTFGSFAATSVQNNYNLRAEKSVSVFDQPNVLTWAFVWEVPVGKGRAFARRGVVVNAIVGGWNVSTLSSLQSGMPLVIGTVQNNTGSLSGGSRANRVRNGVLPGDKRGIYGWFDPTAFVLPAAYTFGNDSRTEPQLRAPGAVNISAMLQKEFRFGEKRWFEFRCQSGNVLNHFNPGSPNTTIGGPGVGTITGGNAGRALQLTLKLHY